MENGVTALHVIRFDNNKSFATDSHQILAEPSELAPIQIKLSNGRQTNQI